MTARDNKKMRSDLLRASTDWLIPILVKKAVELIPRGTKIDDFLRNWKDHWDKIAFGVSTLLLQITNAPDEVDDIMSKLSAEVARTLKRRYEDGDDTIASGGLLKTKTTEVTSLFDVMLLLNRAELIKITTLLSAVSDQQKKSVLNLSYSTKQVAQDSLKNILSLSVDEFKAWVEMIFPDPTPRQESAIEKELKKSLTEFKNDSEKFFQKDSWLTSLAKQKGLM